MKELIQSSLKSMVLFSYSTSRLTKTDRVKFFYALNGRNKLGILDRLNALHLGIAVVLVPSAYAEKFQAFLNSWHVSFEKMEILMEE